jgi:hypothetical protein
MATWFVVIIIHELCYLNHLDFSVTQFQVAGLLCRFIKMSLRGNFVAPPSAPQRGERVFLTWVGITTLYVAYLERNLADKIGNYRIDFRSVSP